MMQLFIDLQIDYKYLYYTILKITNIYGNPLTTSYHPLLKTLNFPYEFILQI